MNSSGSDPLLSPLLSLKELALYLDMDPAIVHQMIQKNQKNIREDPSAPDSCTLSSDTEGSSLDYIVPHDTLLDLLKQLLSKSPQKALSLVDSLLKS